jgi:hypothetical protein
MNMENLRKEIICMTCEEEPQQSETTHQAPAEKPKERKPEEQQEISSKEAKGAPAEDEDG